MQSSVMEFSSTLTTCKVVSWSLVVPYYMQSSVMELVVPYYMQSSVMEFSSTLLHAK